MRLQVSEILTLDGVMEAPEQWVGPYMDQDIGEYVMAALGQTDAMLFGRKTFQEMAAAWPDRTGGMADVFNSIPKYVVSSTLKDVTWNNSHVINGNIAEEVAKLKAQPGGILLVQGSADLVRLLAQHQLIDEYSLHVAPLVLGKGKRLFLEGAQARLQLAKTSLQGRDDYAELRTGQAAIKTHKEKNACHFRPISITSKRKPEKRLRTLKR